MNKRQQQKQETRKLIRDTAKKMFVEQGFKGTTSRDVAKIAGVASGTVFAHFPNKKAILADILFEDIEEVVGRAMGSLPKGTALKQLLYIAKSLYGYYAQHPELSRVLLQYSMDLDSFETRFKNQINQFVEAVSHIISTHPVPPKKDAEAMAEAYVASYFFVLMGFLRQEPINIDDAVEKLERMSCMILE